MKTNIKFSDCLRSLLTIFDISMVRLSKAINVDASLVNRWVNDKRVPAYNTNYIEHISEYLSNLILNSFQIQHLNNLFLQVCGDNKEKLTEKEKIKKILLQSQGFSIEYKNKHKKKNNLNSKLNYSDKNDIVNDNYLTYNSNNLINLSFDDKIIIGYKNILKSSIFILDEAIKNKHNNENNQIYILFRYNQDILNRNKEDFISLRNTVLKAINNGWNIVLLLNIDSNINNLIELIKFIHPLIITGKFIPYYFKKYDLNIINEEIITIPKIGTLFGILNSISSEINTMFYFKNNVAINIFENKFKDMIKNHTRPLIKYYTQNDAKEYYNNLIEHESLIGNRILYKYDLSILLLPQSLYEKLLKNGGFNKEEINISICLYKKRLKSFLSNIYNYKYTDIYSIDCINHLIKNNKIHLYLYNQICEINLNKDEVNEILTNIVNLLKKFNNYNIIFISREFNNKIINFFQYCMLKERSAIILEIYDNIRNFPKVKLSIQEPVLVKAYELYFNKIIEQITPINKDKNDIIHWIQKQISSV